MLVTICLALLTTAIAILATTVYLHRSATHNALVLHPLAKNICKLSIWLTTGMKPWEWVAIHRKHHLYADEKGDPHSPYLEGFWQIQFWNVLYYMKEARNPKTISSYAGDILAARTWPDRHVYAHGFFGVVLGTMILCAILGALNGLIAAGIHAFLYVFVLSSSVNGLCHHPHPLGYQRYRDRHVRRVYNNALVALLTAGEGYHHNHHWKPSLARFGHAPWEFDAGWVAILILEKLGLATNVKKSV